MADVERPIEQVCGQLIVGGFEGTELPEGHADALARGRRGGVILFKRNLESLEQVAALNRRILQAAADELPPLVSVDQEGGRVVRLPPPFTALPPMRQLGMADDVALTRRAAEQVGRELAAAGFNLDFAPVMDVDTNPENPVIGDRAFGSDPRRVMKHGVAYLRGLQERGVLACAKHFPGHGDTEIDSHLALPVVRHGAERLHHVEIPPFRAASGAGVAAMMTAHVVFEALDPGVPATYSRAVCASLLRSEIGFEGILVSDDLEMGAIANHHPIEHAAVEAVWAGCDALIISRSWELQERALAALIERAQGDPGFLQRCRQACERGLGVRRLCPPRVEDDLALARTVRGAAATGLLESIEAAVARADAGEHAPPDSAERLALDEDEP